MPNCIVIPRFNHIDDRFVLVDSLEEAQAYITKQTKIDSHGYAQIAGLEENPNFVVISYGWEEGVWLFDTFQEAVSKHRQLRLENLSLPLIFNLKAINQSSLDPFLEKPKTFSDEQLVIESLCVAIDSDNSRVVKNILRKLNCFPNPTKLINTASWEYETMPIHLACHSAPEILQLIIANGGDPNVLDECFEPPLFWCIDRLDNALILLKAGAKINYICTKLPFWDSSLADDNCFSPDKCRPKQSTVLDRLLECIEGVVCRLSAENPEDPKIKEEAENWILVLAKYRSFGAMTFEETQPHIHPESPIYLDKSLLKKLAKYI